MKVTELIKTRWCSFTAFFRALDFHKFIPVLEITLFGILFLLTSGYSLAEFVFSKRAIAIILLFLTLMSFCLFLLNVNTSKIKSAFATRKLPKPKWTWIALLCLFLFFAVSCCINASSGSNINGIIRLVCLLLTCLFCTATIPFDTFVRGFLRFLAILCILSLCFFAFSFFAPTSFALNLFITDKGTIVYNYGFVCFVLRAANYRVDISTRMAGPFWEPSIFGAVLSLALLLTNLFIKKKRYLYWGIFGICLLLSRSTGGILLGLLSFAALLFENPSKKIRIIRISIPLSSIACAILLLVFLLPNLQKMFPTFLSKISLDSVTFTTRLYSPYYFFLVFLKKPVIGLGPQVAFSTYSSIVDATTVDSATSSFGFFTASFGIPGLLYCLLILVAPFFVKRWNFSTRIIVSLFSLLLFNLENIAYLSIFLLFASYCQKEGLFGTLYLSTSTPEPDKGRNLLFAKSEDGSLARNLNGSLLVKGASMLVGVVAIPVYNRYFVSDDLYGAWLTVVSVLSWTLLFDFGFGSGLRSKLGQAIDNHDEKAQSSLISSTYIGTFAISLFFLAVLMVLIWTVDLNSLLKVPVSALNPVEMKLAMTVLSFGLFFEFVFKNIIYILYAVRRSAIASSFALISNVSLLAFFSISSSFSFSNRFLVAAFVYALTVNVPLFVASFIFFSHKHKREWLPSFHKFRWDICRKVMGVGIAFFGIQIGFFVLSQTDSFLVSSIFSSADVVAYTKYSKIFTFFISLMGAVVQQPIWSAVSTAWSKQDKRGIKKYLKMCLVIAGALFAFCLVAGACLQLIFNVWLGDYSLQVNYLYMFIFVMYSFAYLFSDALIIVCNGLLIIKGQAIITLASAAVKMVLVYTLCLLWKENPLSWCLIVLIDGACYLPYLFALPQLIHKKIALIPEAPSRVEK